MKLSHSDINSYDGEEDWAYFAGNLNAVAIKKLIKSKEKINYNKLNDLI
jgi:hypothetical protein